MILFTGLTGAVGTEIVKLLPEFAIQARGLVRDPAKADLIKAAGVEVITGELGDPVTVKEALRGCDKAFLLMANSREQLVLEKSFVDAARASGVRHLVKMSANGANSNSTSLLKRYHGDSEQHIRDSGLSYTLVRPNYFMQNMFHVAAGIVEQDKYFMPMRDGQVGIIDVRDVARFILAVLTSPGHENKTYEITGPELVSFHDIAGQLSNVMGREILYVDVPAEDFKESLSQWVPDDWYVETVSDMFKLTAQGRGALLNDIYSQVTGRAPTTLRQFFQDYSSFFEKS